MGQDNINSFLLKLALPYVVESSRSEGSQGYPITQNQSLSDPNNFRPISLLSILTKPLERHIHKHLTQFIEDRNLFFFSFSFFIPFSLVFVNGIPATQP